MLLCVLTIVVDCHLRLLIEDYVDYDASVCGILQYLVQSKL